MEKWVTSLSKFVANDPVVIVVALSILVFALLVYRIWFYSKIDNLRSALTELVTQLKGAEGGWPAVNDAGRSVCNKYEVLRAPWRETEARVMQLPHGNSHVSVMFGPVNDLWSPNKLLRPTMNVAVFEAMPNLLVGIGLLFTFFFLSMALAQATLALTGQAQEQAQIMKATQDLLSTAGAKFTTSLAGLLASIVWTVFAKNRMATLARSADEVADLISRVVSMSGSEMAIYGQLQVLHKLDVGAQEHKEILAELLEESKEQTGSLKRFETDLAVTLGNTITAAFSPQIERMTTQLEKAINGLSEKLGTMNQDALSKMMGDFAGMIKESTATEMNVFRESLGKLADRLDSASISLTEGANESGKALDGASKNLAANVGNAAESLVNGAALLDAALLSAKAAINDLDATVENATVLGRSGADRFSQSLAETDAVLEKLRSTGEGWGKAVVVLSKTSGQLAEVVNGIEELAQEQKGVIQAVKDATPNALATIGSVSEVLKTSALQAEKSMHEARDAMERTGKTLGGTVTAITEGVQEYSTQLAVLHTEMDSQVSKAVNQIGGAIASLEEAVEELGEILDAKVPKG
jgi:Mg2+ and Co2+ transporter CorA